MNGNQPLASSTIDNDDHSRGLNDLQNHDIYALVSSFVQSNAGHPLVRAVASLLNAIASKKPSNLQCLVNELLSTLTDRQLYNGLCDALKAHMEVHPWQTAFLIIGIVLLCNPLAMTGFGSLGPVAGSLAAAWQSSMGGTVAAGSAFAVLQSWGMTYSIIMPVAGTIITAGSVVAATAGEQIRETCNHTMAIANAGGQEVGKWSRGEYGNPATEWWNGVYGNPVTRWCKGEYGSPVAGWANSVTKE